MLAVFIIFKSTLAKIWRRIRFAKQTFPIRIRVHPAERLSVMQAKSRKTFPAGVFLRLLTDLPHIKAGETEKPLHGLLSLLWPPDFCFP